MCSWVMENTINPRMEKKTKSNSQCQGEAWSFLCLY